MLLGSCFLTLVSLVTSTPDIEDLATLEGTLQRIMARAPRVDTAPPTMRAVEAIALRKGAREERKKMEGEMERLRESEKQARMEAQALTQQLAAIKPTQMESSSTLVPSSPSAASSSSSHSRSFGGDDLANFKEQLKKVKEARAESRRQRSQAASVDSSVVSTSSDVSHIRGRVAASEISLEEFSRQHQAVYQELDTVIEEAMEEETKNQNILVRFCSWVWDAIRRIFGAKGAQQEVVESPIVAPHRPSFTEIMMSRTRRSRREQSELDPSQGEFWVY